MTLLTVSVVFLSYKQERFVEEALRAALAQDVPEFELIIADDASPDGTWAVIESVLAEPIRPGIRVKSLRQPKNLGILGNFNAALAMATGEIFVLMAGDDVSYPSRAKGLIIRSDGLREGNTVHLIFRRRMAGFALAAFRECNIAYKMRPWLFFAQRRNGPFSKDNSREAAVRLRHTRLL